MTFRSEENPGSGPGASIIFLSEPEGLVVEEQPKRWVSKTGDYVLVSNPYFEKDMQRTKLAGDFVGSFLTQRKSVPTNPFEESHHALSIASASVGLVGY